MKCYIGVRALADYSVCVNIYQQPVTLDLGEIGVEQGGEGERGKGGGDGVFPLMAEPMEERARPEQHWPGMFIGHPCQFRQRDISRPPSSPNGAHMCLIR